MSSTNVNALSAGVQQLYNSGILPSNTSTSVLKSASSGQLNQLAGSSLALQETDTLFGLNSSTTDSATLSTTATDSLTQAVNNQLTESLDAAVNKFLPNSSSSSSNTSGSQINVVG